MRIESDHPEVETALKELARVVCDNAGSIDADFTVRERSAQFSAGAARGANGRVLLQYPLELRPPMERLQWDDVPDRLVPIRGIEHLSRTQRQIVEAWLVLVNATEKPGQISQHVPRFALTHWVLRHHLADGGYPAMREAPSREALRNTLIAWHSAGAGSGEGKVESAGESAETGGQRLTEDSNTAQAPLQRWRLIPLKCFVNHHPAGAKQQPLPGRVAVAAATPTATNETFENYGDLDAMQLLMNFGYLDDAAPLVHSVPVEVESRYLGRVVVRWRAPRNPRSNYMKRDVPTITPSQDGIVIQHLTARAGNRSRVEAFLAMAAQARSGLKQHDALAEAHAVVNAIAQANLDYYRRLDELVVSALAAPAPTPLVEGFGTEEILPTIAAMSLLQQQRLQHMWG